MQLKKIQNEFMIADILNYVAYLQSKGRKQSTIKRYCYDLEDCFHYFLVQKFGNSLCSFTSENYRQYFAMLKEEKSYSDKTLHRIYVALNKFLSFLEENKGVKNPLPTLHLNIQPDRSLTTADFISEKEGERLFQVLKSKEGLSEKQLKVRDFLIDRNVAIVNLMLTYGLTLKEIVSLNMNNIHFEQNEIEIVGSRTIFLSHEDKQILYNYFHTIPKPVRPDYHSHQPFFVAFDFNRNTFHFVYENNSPKALTEIAIQKMIRLEVARGRLRKGISPQHFRNTYILQLMKQSLPPEEIMAKTGLTSKVALRRYYDFVG